ncbi:hypothetical protein G6662_05925 [Polynucleobacter paneuropaeus]|jgi:hypothetical protein|nr:hypothetical protein [Polynucleobacter paneuropaeus]
MTPLSGWDARSNLDFDIEPKSSIKANIFMPLPPTPGEYYIEATGLQEGVVWLHDLGNKTALSKKISINHIKNP